MVEILVYAAYDPMEITREDLAGDLRGQMKELIKRLENRDPKELEDEVARHLRFNLCPPCQKKYLQNPVPPCR